jgi:Tripartite tricarboxylate transporter family receptor
MSDFDRGEATTQSVLRIAMITLAAGIVLGSARGRAQSVDPSAFPSHTVKLVVPAAGGSTADTLARIVAEKLSRMWGKPVIVENIGGGVVLGAAQVFRTAPDGYTLIVSPPSRSIIFSTAYDPSRFVPVVLLARVPNALVVRNDLPAGNVSGLIAYPVPSFGEPFVSRPPSPPRGRDHFCPNRGVSVRANRLSARYLWPLQVRHFCHQVAVEPILWSARCCGRGVRVE